MSEQGYTPTTGDVREALAEWMWSRRMFRDDLSVSDGMEFARWLAAHDREVAAKALDDASTWIAHEHEGWVPTDSASALSFGILTGVQSCAEQVVARLRARAAQIREGES